MTKNDSFLALLDLQGAWFDGCKATMGNKAYMNCLGKILIKARIFWSVLSDVFQNQKLFPLQGILILGILFLCLSAGKCAVSIRSSGFLDAEMYSGKRVVQQESSRNSFTATVMSDGKWLLSVFPIHEKGDALHGTTNVIYMSFDGVDTFYCEYTEAVIELRNGKPTLVETKPISERRLQSYVSSGNYPFSPFDSQRRAHVLWLVYGIGHAMHYSGSNSIPLPWYPARSTPLAFGYRMDNNLTAIAPYFPKNITFVRDFSLDLSNEDDELLRPEMDVPQSSTSLAGRKEDLNIRKLKWKEGELAGSLTVEGQTNIAEFNVPTVVSIKTFASFGRLRRLYRVTVTNVVIETDGKISDEDFRPPVLTKLLVLDSRFRLRDSKKNIDFINYKLETAQKWLPMQTPELTNLFSAYAGNPTISSRKRSAFFLFSGKRIVLLVLISTLTALPIFCLGKFCFNKKQNVKANKNE